MRMLQRHVVARICWTPFSTKAWQQPMSPRMLEKDRPGADLALAVTNPRDHTCCLKAVPKHPFRALCDMHVSKARPPADTIWEASAAAQASMAPQLSRQRRQRLSYSKQKRCLFAVWNLSNFKELLQQPSKTLQLLQSQTSGHPGTAARQAMRRSAFRRFLDTQQ